MLKLKRNYINFVSTAYFSIAATVIEIIGGVKVYIHSNSPEILLDADDGRFLNIMIII